MMNAHAHYHTRLKQSLITLLLFFSITAKAQTTLTLDDVSFETATGEITGYNGTALDIIIPPSFNVDGTEVSITNIGWYAFQNKGLTNVSFPNTITTIENMSFRGNELTSVTLPTSLTKLGPGAFTNNAVTEINGSASDGFFYAINEDGSEDNTIISSYGGASDVVDFIPNTVKSFASNSFGGCELTAVTIPYGVTGIGDTAFGDNLLTSVIIPNSVTSLGAATFDVNKLTSVVLSDNLTSMSFHCFRNNLLENISIPSGITKIFSSTFENNKLTSVLLTNTLTEIERDAFKNNLLSTLSLPSSIIKVGSNAFTNNKLTSLTIPASLISIGSNAFSNNLLNAVAFEPNSNITNIAANVFITNTELSSINLPSHGNPNFDDYADANGIKYAAGSSITDFEMAYRARLLKTLTLDDVSFNASTGTITSYSGTTTDMIIPESFTVNGEPVSVTEIGYNVFNSKGIYSLVLPNTLTKIGDRSFGSNSLTELIIPDNCQLGESSFNRNNIKDIVFPLSITHIPSSCFSYNNFDNLIIPSHVKSIGTSAFYFCYINTLTLNEGLETIGNSAFNINNLSSVTIPNSVASLGKSGFARNKLTEVNFKETLQLGGGCFTNNQIVEVNTQASNGIFYSRNLDGTEDNTKIVSYGGVATAINFLDNGVTYIDSSAFRQCGLSSLVLPTQLKHIAYYAFADNYSLQVVTLPNTLTHLGNGVFSRCRIETIEFPASIEYIGDKAFEYGNISAISFKENSHFKKIGSDVFDNASKLPTTIKLPTNVSSGFIEYRDANNNAYNPGDIFIDINKQHLARCKAIISLEDVEFDTETGTITGYNGLITDIIIPSSFNINGNDVAVLNIGASAFSRKNLYSIEMANSITNIESSAFSYNSFIEDVKLSSNLMYISNNAFRNTIPSSGEIALPNSGVWHQSYSISNGTETTTITSSNSHRNIYRVFTVKFVDHDDAVLKSEAVFPKGAATAPADPTRDGYTFLEWDSNFSVINSDRTIKAYYTINKYLVTFVDWDGSNIDDQNIEFGSAATAPTDPIRAGHNFTGWDTDFSNVTGPLTVIAEYDVATSVKAASSAQFSIYPNPVVNTLNVNLSNIEAISFRGVYIYNIAGQQVYFNSDFTNKISISVSDWNAGIYYIQVNKKSIKFIKQ